MSSPFPELPFSRKTQESLDRQAEIEQTIAHHHQIVDDTWRRYRNSIGAKRHETAQNTFAILSNDAPTEFENATAKWHYTASGHLSSGTAVTRHTHITVAAKDMPRDVSDQMMDAMSYLNGQPVPGKKLRSLLGVNAERTGGRFSRREIPKLELAHAYGRKILEHVNVIWATSYDIAAMPKQMPVHQQDARILSDWYAIDQLPISSKPADVRKLREDAVRCLLTPESPQHAYLQDAADKLTDDEFGGYLFAKFAHGEEPIGQFEALDEINVNLRIGSAVLPAFVQPL